MKLSQYNWSERAKNVLNKGGITSFRELASLTALELQTLDGCGLTTIREFLRVLIHVCNLIPEWSKSISVHVDRPKQVEYQADIPGLVFLAGPYGPGERGLLERAIAQLGSVSSQVFYTDKGLVIYRDARGVKVVDDE